VWHNKLILHSSFDVSFLIGGESNIVPKTPVKDPGVSGFPSTPKKLKFGFDIWNDDGSFDSQPEVAVHVKKEKDITKLNELSLGKQ